MKALRIFLITWIYTQFPTSLQAHNEKPTLFTLPKGQKEGLVAPVVLKKDIANQNAEPQLFAELIKSDKKQLSIHFLNKENESINLDSAKISALAIFTSKQSGKLKRQAMSFTEQGSTFIADFPDDVRRKVNFEIEITTAKNAYFVKFSGVN